MCPHNDMYMRPHTDIYVCPHTAINVLWNTLATTQDTHDQESNAPSATL